MMVVNTTETCWWLAVYNNIHCTKVHSSVFYAL